MRRKRLLAAAAVAVILSAAAALFYARTRTARAQQTTASTPAAAPEYLNYTATVEARSVVPVAAPVAGTIETLEVEIGDQVYEGQIIARIKNVPAASAAEQAQEELDRARERVQQIESILIESRLEASRASADSSRASGELARLEKVLQRQQTLYRAGAGARLAFEKAQREYDGAKIEADGLAAVQREIEDRVAGQVKELEAAKRILEQKQADSEEAQQGVASGEVRSPVTGTIVARRGSAGTEVSPEIKDLFEIATDLSVMDAVITANPAERAWIKPGQAALVRFVELGNDSFPGVVREIKNDHVYVEFTSPSPVLKPGGKVQVTIDTAAAIR